MRTNYIQKHIKLILGSQLMINSLLSCCIWEMVRRKMFLISIYRKYVCFMMDNHMTYCILKMGIYMVYEDSHLTMILKQLDLEICINSSKPVNVKTAISLHQPFLAELYQSHHLPQSPPQSPPPSLPMIFT